MIKVRWEEDAQVANADLGIKNQEIKMEAWDTIQKQRHYLPTKIHLVKAVVYPAVMYGCESWTVKKAECQIIDAF